MEMAISVTWMTLRTGSRRLYEAYGLDATFPGLLYTAVGL